MGYLDTVRSVAEEVREEYPDPVGDRVGRERYVAESVDGSEWIIYPAKNQEVLDNTDNEPDASEVRSMSKPDADWKQMRTVAASLAMGADIWDELRKLDEKAEEQGEEMEGSMTASQHLGYALRVL